MTITRRAFTAGMAATGLSVCAAPALAQKARYFSGVEEDNGYHYRKTNFEAIDPEWRRQVVQYYSPEPPGTLVVDTNNHFLYQIYKNNTALRYGVGVGREGFQWFGRARIDRRQLWPRWTPPPEMRQRQPNLPEYVEGGAAKLTDKATGAVTEVATKKTEVEGASAMMVRSAPARSISIATGATWVTGCTARWSPGRSARTSPAAASGCSRRTSSISISAPRTGRR